MKKFTTKQIVQIANVTVQNIHYWSNSGVFQPYDLGLGRGTTRRYDYPNILEIVIAKKLSTCFHINIIKNTIIEIHNERAGYFSESLEETLNKSKKNLVILRSENHRTAIINIDNFTGFVHKKDDYFQYNMLLTIIDLAIIKKEIEPKLKEVE